MIISSVKLEPFGCFASRVLDFKNGLNIIIGPNEAGKSTVFYAIQKVLFTQSNLKKIDFKKKMERYIPIGGDTAHVAITINFNGRSFALQRTWGGTASAELVVDGDTLITDEMTIDEELSQVFPATAGTFKAVLMTYQSGLMKTIDTLKTDYPSTVHSLGDILRKAVLETDGVSIEAFKEKIHTLHSGYFDHWDDNLQLPEKKRGIENPWKKQVGIILQHYYRQEETRAALNRARNHEDQHDRYSRQISEYGEQIEKTETFLKENKKIYEDAQSRKTLSAELEAHKANIDIYSKVNTDWPVRESNVKEIKSKLPGLEKKLQSLTEQRMAAEAAEQNKSLRETYKRAEEKKKALDKAEKKLKGVRKMTSEDLEELKKTSQEMQVLEAQMSAGRLSAKFTARRDMNLTVQKDVDEKAEQTLSSGDAFEIQAGGILALDHEDWSLQITSGDGSVDESLSQHRIVKDKFNSLLKLHNVASIEKAKKIHKVFNEFQNAVTVAEQVLQNELGDNSYNELEKKIDELGDAKNSRPLVEVVEELKGCENELSGMKEKKQQHEDVIANYKKDYTDMKSLLLALGKKMQEQKDAQDKFDKLAPLPDGVKDVDVFLSQYETRKESQVTDKEQLNEAKVALASLESAASDISVEELEQQLAEDEEQFRRQKQRGDAVRRVKELTESLVDEMDSGMHTGLKRELEQHISFVTDKKYEEVALNGVLPEGFIRKDGKSIPYDLLSTGTKDVLALSLRLAMASHFLKESSGFIMMDDPLVDLDPDRQKKAAELLNIYAEQKQVLIFTCHPSHAELLRGTRIAL